MKTLIPTIQFPELVFGFVAPIGASVDRAVSAFAAEFRARKYDVVDIKVTNVYEDLKAHIKPDPPLKDKPPRERYRTYIRYGDQLCRKFEDDSFLAATTIREIVLERAALPRWKDKSAAFSQTVFLLHQFKRREEIELLRSVYGEIFFQVSVYSRRGARVDELARKFATGEHSANIDSYRSAAEELVQIDENETGEHGQEVGKIFHAADFIVNLDHTEPPAEKQVKRFCDLLFSSNRISPTKMEYGMFLAKGAALRSLDLSRQVGACILNENGQIVSLGLNEVPKALGGSYWSDEPFDDRDYKRGGDPNDARKKEILSELLSALGYNERIPNILEKENLKSLLTSKESTQLVTDVLKVLGYGRELGEFLKDPKIKDSQLMDALEYGRIIHAEMSALCDAARGGRRVAGTTLYCTTFPCHMCSKHIIGSGISKVVFLEPYPKSLTFRLHNDAVKIEGGDRGQYADFPSVEFVHFFGVTPRRYQEMFQRGKRKNERSEFQEYIEGMQKPLLEIKSPYYTQTEALVLGILKNKYREKFGTSADMLAEGPPNPPEDVSA